MSLYAVWDDAVTLTYDVNGGQGSGTVVTVRKGSAAEITELDPQRYGYLFLGWADTPDARGGEVP